MDKLVSPDIRDETEQKPRRRRFGFLGVLWRFVIAVAIVAGAGFLAQSMIAEKGEPVSRQPRERSFTVEVFEPALADYAAAVRTYGEVVAARSVSLRAEVSGPVTVRSDNLVAGGRVAAGETLVEIDRFNYAGALTDARAAQTDTELGLTEARQTLNLQQVNLDAAEQQLVLAEKDLERAGDLVASGTLTNKEYETRELTVSQRRQTVQQAEINLSLQAAKISRQEAALARTQWAVDQAERNLAKTTIAAPFDAIIVETDVSVGALLGQNEAVATLYDADALEVRFTISDQQYAEIGADALLGRPVTIHWETGATPVAVRGEIIRIGAEVDASLGGVELFANVIDAAGALFPGTFVAVTFDGPVYAGTFKVPESAIYDSSTVYAVKQRRMQPVDIEILARDGAEVIVRGAIEDGRRIVVTHLAQAGEGVLITVAGEEDMQVGGGGDGPGGGPGGGGGGGHGGM